MAPLVFRSLISYVLIKFVTRSVGGGCYKKLPYQNISCLQKTSYGLESWLFSLSDSKNFQRVFVTESGHSKDERQQIFFSPS